LYIKITKEKYPRVLTARKIDLDKDKGSVYFGPYPSSQNVNSVLRIVRKIFPFCDHKLAKRACIRYQIGLCKPCPNVIESENDPTQKAKTYSEYLNNIKMIKRILSRKSSLVKNALVKRMSKLSKNENYEEAIMIREQIRKLEYIQQPINKETSFIENPNLIEDIRKDESINLEKIIYKITKNKLNIIRIECFDIAHISGEFTTASMVTFIAGEPVKELYRRFKIRNNKKADDLEAMREVARMRMKHLKDWGKPDLIIVDGGKTQINAFKKYIKDIEVLGIAKGTQKLIVANKAYDISRLKAYNLIRRIDDEAHRFARRYHHLLVKKMLFS
jgi:excinuclease ABC subunit C